MHPPFVGCYAVHAFSFASEIDPKLMPKEKNQITKSMHRYTMLSSASSKSPFWLRLRSLETLHASHLDTEVTHCLRRN